MGIKVETNSEITIFIRNVRTDILLQDMTEMRSFISIMFGVLSMKKTNRPVKETEKKVIKGKSLGTALGEF